MVCDSVFVVCVTCVMFLTMCGTVSVCVCVCCVHAYTNKLLARQSVCMYKVYSMSVAQNYVPHSHETRTCWKIQNSV